MGSGAGRGPRSRHGRSPFVLNVRSLRSRPLNREEVRLAGAIAELSITDAFVPEDAEVRFDGVIESMPGGVSVAGSVTALWSGTCRRCLEPASGILVAEVRELCRDPGTAVLPPRRQGLPGSRGHAAATGSLYEAGEDFYPVGPDELDVEPIVRDACILELPLAPLCSDSCRGLCPTCGANLNGDVCSCAIGHE